MTRSSPWALEQHVVRAVVDDEAVAAAVAGAAHDVDVGVGRRRTASAPAALSARVDDRASPSAAEQGREVPRVAGAVRAAARERGQAAGRAVDEAVEHLGVVGDESLRPERRAVARLGAERVAGQHGRELLDPDAEQLAPRAGVSAGSHPIVLIDDAAVEGDERVPPGGDRRVERRPHRASRTRWSPGTTTSR